MWRWGVAENSKGWRKLGEAASLAARECGVVKYSRSGDPASGAGAGAGVTGVTVGGEMVGREGFQPEGESEGVDGEDEVEEQEESDRVRMRANMVTVWRGRLRVRIKRLELARSSPAQPCMRADTRCRAGCRCDVLRATIAYHAPCLRLR